MTLPDDVVDEVAIAIYNALERYAISMPEADKLARAALEAARYGEMRECLKRLATTEQNGFSHSLAIAEAISLLHHWSSIVMEDSGRSPDGSGSRPTDEAASASSPKASIPNADDLWCDEINTLVNWAFGRVSRNPSDHETAKAYRIAIASVLSHYREGWRWEIGNFMGFKGWMWRRSASAIEAQRAATAKTGAVHESAVGNAETPSPDLGATQP